ncbi:transposon Tf2-11 polyprotein [Trichonephila clavipes]|nr:transposon Tf2-11 polyprotein [Trichonephila clavipes]
MEAIPIPEITAEIVGRAFYEKWICRFGVPAKIVTDQGRQFEAELFRSIAAICGAKVAHTTSYHPQYRLKPAYLLAVDNQNEQTSVGQKNEISNWKELSPMPDEQSTTSCGRKIKKPVRFRE